MQNGSAEILFHRTESHARAGNAGLGTLPNWLSALGGGGLVFYGLTCRSLPGAALAATGGYLAYYGVLGLTGHEERRSRPIKVQRAFTVNRPPEDCYRYWRVVENLPRLR